MRDLIPGLSPAANERLALAFTKGEELEQELTDLLLNAVMDQDRPLPRPRLRRLGRWQ